MRCAQSGADPVAVAGAYQDPVTTTPTPRHGESPFTDPRKRQETLFWQGGYWSSTLQAPFEVLHDDSTSVQRWQETIFGSVQREMADRTTPDSFTIGEVTIHLPTLLQTITFGSSHDDPRLQVADILAGAAAHMYAVATEARRDEGNFAKALYRAGVNDLIKEAVGPNPD